MGMLLKRPYVVPALTNASGRLRPNAISHPGLSHSAGGAPFSSPLDYAPALWIDAALSALFQNSNGTTAAAADADPVGYWSDLSGNGNHPIQATAGKRPLLKLGANGINGLPCLLFDALDDFLAVTYSGAVGPPLTVYFVGSFGSTANHRVAYDGVSAIHRAQLLALQTSGFLRINDGGASADATVGGILGCYSGLFSESAITLRQNGTQIITGAGTGAQSMTGVTVGSDATTAFPLAGKMAALIVYSGAHTSTQQQQIEAYYQNRGYWP